MDLAERMQRTSKADRRKYFRLTMQLGRIRVEMSQLARSIDFHEREKKRLVVLMRTTARKFQSLEDDIAKLKRRSNSAGEKQPPPYEKNCMRGACNATNWNSRRKWTEAR